jgi:hypothetical protein
MVGTPREEYRETDKHGLSEIVSKAIKRQTSGWMNKRRDRNTFYGARSRKSRLARYTYTGFGQH